MRYRLKHLFFVICVLLLFSLQLNAQDFTQKVKQLTNRIETSSKVEEKIDLHMELCWILRNRDPKMAMFHGNKALSLIDQSKTAEKKAKALNYLGVVHRNKGEYSYALGLYEQALKSATKTGDQVQIAYSYNNIGGIYTLTNSYPEAIEAIEKAKKIFTKLGNKKGIGYAAINLGNLYRHLKNYSESLIYFEEAQKIKKELNDSVGSTIVKQLVADIYKQQGKIDQAAQLFQVLKQENIHNKDLKGQAIVTNELAKIKLEKGSYEQALKLFTEAENINRKIENKQGLSYNTINIGLANIHLNHLKLAKRNIDEGLELGSELGDKRTLLKAYSALTQLYTKEKSWKKAFEAQSKYIKTYDELYNFNQSAQISSIRNKYKNENRFIKQQLDEAKNKKLEQENKFAKKQAKILSYSGGLLFILLLILLFFFYLYRKNAKNNERSNTLLSQQNFDLKEANTTKEKFLSIIGHDLKNPFNSVLGLSNLLIDQWKSLEEEERFQISNEINHSSQSIYELLDNLLIWSRTQTENTIIHPTTFDINESINQIFEIFKNQANFKKINVRLNISGKKMVYADPNMIQTVIRNLFSNALKFTHSGGQIIISTQQKADMVEFSISDNGKGILPDDLKKIFEDKGLKASKGTANETGSGLGLLLAKDFIVRNKGLIWVESKSNKGSQFTFNLPLK